MEVSLPDPLLWLRRAYAEAPGLTETLVLGAYSLNRWKPP